MPGRLGRKVREPGKEPDGKEDSGSQKSRIGGAGCNREEQLSELAAGLA